LAYPTSLDTYPGIIVIQEVFGVNSYIRSVVDRLAKLGYGAIAPAIYQRYAPGFEVGYSPEELAEGRRYKNMTQASELLSDVEATIAYLQTLPRIKSQGFGCMGFCFGGHVTYLAAILPTIKAAACFYGAGIPTLTPGGGEPTLNRTPEIQATLYGFFGLEDPLIPVEHVDQIETELQRHQKNYKIFRYANAGHGFCCDQRSDYRADACEDAWQQVTSLFAEV
jgi:carboxymethylenebutenolidase